MAKPCVFCAIVRGEERASFVAREGGVSAFLDVRPLFPGHTLVVTDEHIDDLDVLPRPLIEPLFGLAQRVGRALPKALGADGTFLGVNTRISQSVPHVHVHVVPRRKGDGLRGFFWPRTKYDSVEERDAIAARIAAAL